MSDHPILPFGSQLPGIRAGQIPVLFSHAGQRAVWRFIEFFTAHIRNPNTREAYGRAVGYFAAWCAKNKLELLQLNPFLIASYVEHLGKEIATPSVKQHLAAI